MVLCLSIEDDWPGEPLLLRCSQLLLDRLCQNNLAWAQICLTKEGFRSHNYSQRSRGTREKYCIRETLNLLTCVSSSTNTPNPPQKLNKNNKLSVVSCQVSGVRCQVSGVRCNISCVECRASPITCDMSITPTATATERWDNLSIFQGQSNIRTISSVATDRPTNQPTSQQTTTQIESLSRFFNQL